MGLRDLHEVLEGEHRDNGRQEDDNFGHHSIDVTLLVRFLVCGLVCLLLLVLLVLLGGLRVLLIWHILLSILIGLVVLVLRLGD